MNEDRKLTGKVAMVFGGSRGIGAAAARRLAREGANVGLTYVSAPDKAADMVQAIEEEGRNGFAIKADPAEARRRSRRDCRSRRLFGERRVRLHDGLQPDD
jgi:3-oxoacyl-[acyl-carrier protein] reductase